MRSPKTLARIAGVLYMLLAAGSAFNQGYVLPHIVKPGDAAATAANIRASEPLFRAGFLADLVAGVFFLATAMALYVLLRHVNQPVAAAMVTFVVVAVATGGQLNQYTALTIATDENYTRTFGAAGSDALTLLSLTMQHDGFVIGSMYFGLWLLPLGWLVVKSGYFPKLLGILLMITCGGYLASLFTHFLAPGAEHTVTLLLTYPAGIGELAFIAWLLVKGVNISAPDTRVPSLAEDLDHSP